MRYGVLSDVHSNLEALDAALAALRAEKVEGYILCGDLVGYGADPDACLEALAALPNLRAVAGNHDLAVLGTMSMHWFNDHARAAAQWTQRRLDAKGRSFLESLPLRLETAEFSAAHGSPRDPLEEYMLAPAQMDANLEHIKISPCFVGHSHLPLRFEHVPGGPSSSARIEPGESVTLSATSAWVLNPGSVGQPRDGDPRASCAVFDPQGRTFKLLRLEYDVAGAQNKIRKAGLPEILAKRLSYGD